MLRADTKDRKHLVLPDGSMTFLLHLSSLRPGLDDRTRQVHGSRIWLKGHEGESDGTFHFSTKGIVGLVFFGLECFALFANHPTVQLALMVPSGLCRAVVSMALPLKSQTCRNACSCATCFYAREIQRQCTE